MLRAKVVALLLGPQGIGLMGLFTAIQELGAQVADGGAGHSTVRRVAQLTDDPAGHLLLCRMLAIAITGLGAAAAALIAIWRADLAVWTIGDAAYAPEIAVLGIGIALTMVSRALQAVLSGKRRVAALARIAVAGSALATAVGLALVWLMGEDGLIWVVLAHPAAHVLAALMQRPGGPIAPAPRWTARSMLREARAVFGPGLGLMLSALTVLMVPLILRIWLVRIDGLEAAGLFQAASVIALHLSGLMLASVSMDLYPRLSAAAGDPARMCAIAIGQARLHLALGAPVSLCLIGFAPLVLALLYADAFRAAAQLLQWMLIGGLIRLVAVPMEMTLTATARAGTVLAVQLGHQVAVLGASLLLYPDMGLAGLGLAFCLGQALHVALMAVFAPQGSAILRHPGIALALPGAVAAGGALLVLGQSAPGHAAPATIAATLCAGLAALWTAGRLGLGPARTHPAPQDAQSPLG